jgi:hypothetical protein
MSFLILRSPLEDMISPHFFAETVQREALSPCHIGQEPVSGPDVTQTFPTPHVERACPGSCGSR